MGWITTLALARDILGSKAKGLGRAGRDWCQANAVPYHRRGKWLYVRLVDVRAAIERVAGPPPTRALPPIERERPMRKVG